MRQSLDELIDQLKGSLQAAYDTGNDDPPDAAQGLRQDTGMFVLRLISADDQLSCAELDLFHELLPWAFNHTIDRDLMATYLRGLMDRPAVAPYFEAAPRTPFLLTWAEIYDQRSGTTLAAKARHVLFDLANIVVKIDGTVSPEEVVILEKLKGVLNFNPDYNDGEEATTREKPKDLDTAAPKDGRPAGSAPRFVPPAARPFDELVAELGTLIGLGTVKADVRQLANVIRVAKLRQSRGLKAPDMSLHMVFCGNPGTGKTAVARLIAQIYRSLGVLSKGHLIETERSGLVAGYVGQTALQAKKVVENAMGGVLFIDEAYALAPHDQGWDFGQEAIEVILKEMEDHREDLVVIVAGYPEPMGRFIDSNPGLQSRFTKYLRFPDYEPAELMLICDRFCEQSEYMVEPAARAMLQRAFTTAYESRDSKFGNARMVRNVFEQAISNLADRIVDIGSVTDEMLTTVTVADVEKLLTVDGRVHGRDEE